MEDRTRRQLKRIRRRLWRKWGRHVEGGYFALARGVRDQIDLLDEVIDRVTPDGS